MTDTSPTVRDYLQLFRIPNVFTAVADVTMGYLFAASPSGLASPQAYVCLAAASGLLYIAGMVLNDVFDVEQDRRERPSRPIVAGRISLPIARRVGIALLLSGVVCGWAAGYLPYVEAQTPWRSGVIATLLALLITLYDAWLKRTLLGPVAMGGCRFLNVLLGMSLAPVVTQQSVFLGFHPAPLLVAAGIGLYILGVTWFARSEARTSSRWQLTVATVVMGGGLTLLALLYRALPANMPRLLARENTWLLLLGLLAFTILRRCAIAVADPSPQHVQLAVKNAIWSLIMLDAAVVLLVGHVTWSIAVAALLLPTMFLGRWIAST